MDNAIMDASPTMVDTATGSQTPWSTTTFVDVIKGKGQKQQFYYGEGEEEPMDDLGLTNILQDQDAIEDGEICAFVDIP